MAPHTHDGDDRRSALDAAVVLLAAVVCVGLRGLVFTLMERYVWPT
jgi:hypothetical protein